MVEERTGAEMFSSSGDAAGMQCAVCEHAHTCVHADMYHLLEVLSLATGPQVNDGEGNDAGENCHNNEDHSDDDIEDEPCWESMQTIELCLCCVTCLRASCKCHRVCSIRKRVCAPH